MLMNGGGVMHRVRKSLFMTFRKCPQQGVYMNRDRDNESYGTINMEVPALAKGQIFHHAAEDFWTGMPGVEELNKYNELELKEVFDKRMPITEHEELKVWFEWYVNYEVARWWKLKGKGLLEYFHPFKMEIAMEAEINGLIRTGHADRIDRIGDDELIVVEYKTGKSYDPDNSVAISNLRSELYWYKSVMEEMEEFKGYKITGWRLINPTVGKIAQGKFVMQTKYAVDKQADKILKLLNGEEEPKLKVGMHCQWCDWMEECMAYKDKDHEIFGLLEEVKIDNQTKEAD